MYVPANKKCMYPRYTVVERPKKDEKDQTRITCGGDVLDYFGDVTTHTVSIETIKLHWNLVLSTPGAKYCTGDISNMYLMYLLPNAEYVQFRYDLIPPRIIAYYNLDSLVINSFVYARINRGWYGLKYSGFIAHQDLIKYLKKHGYIRAGVTNGLFKHITRDISFCLVVDDFGIKYTNEEDVQHLIRIIREKYTFKVDFEAKQYIGIHLKWNYEKRELICSIKGYVKQALIKLKQIASTQHQAAPSKVKRLNYCAKTQYVDNNETRPLTPTKIKKIKRALGKFLYYARGIDITMQNTLNDVAADAKNGTKATNKAIKHFLDYAHNNPDAENIFRASDMILNANSDAAYLVARNARSRAGGYHYCGSKDGKLFNGAFYSFAKIIKSVMASAMEAKIAALFINAQKLVKYRQTLQDIGHPQPPTPICTDNLSACGIINGTMKQKRSKSIDM